MACFRAGISAGRGFLFSLFPFQTWVIGGAIIVTNGLIGGTLYGLTVKASRFVLPMEGGGILHRTLIRQNRICCHLDHEWARILRLVLTAAPYTHQIDEEEENMGPFIDYDVFVAFLDLIDLHQLESLYFP